jgi:aerobic-type carbon monoxide dehydrogenase small subunit (CoxS/CutS family)
MTEKKKITLKVNGVSYDRVIEPRILLSDFIRHELDLGGTHVGCEHGICGSCTILMDGLAVRSCLTFALQAEGKAIETVESLSVDNKLNALQNAFWENQGLQCGFCTPGILMSMKAFLEENPTPSREEIREALSGNLCRCTGYHDIVDSVAAAASSALSSDQA